MLAWSCGHNSGHANLRGMLISEVHQQKEWQAVDQLGDHIRCKDALELFSMGEENTERKLETCTIS